MFCLDCFLKMLRRSQWFLWGVLGYLFIALYLLFTTSKGEVELWLNQKHTLWADIFFSYITFLGDGIFILILFLVFLFVRFYEALLLFLVYIFSGLPVQLLKNTLFQGEPRPKIFFENNRINVHLVEGVEVYSFNSFPSGHSATAFAVYLFMAMMLPAKYKFWGIGLFLLALLVSISRVYLLQHFLVDTLVGTCIGTIVGFITVSFVENRTELKDKLFWQRKIKIIS